MEAILQVGSSGEFTVLVGGSPVVTKGWLGFPSEEKILKAVRAALDRG